MKDLIEKQPCCQHFDHTTHRCLCGRTCHKSAEKHTDCGNCPAGDWDNDPPRGVGYVFNSVALKFCPCDCHQSADTGACKTECCPEGCHGATCPVHGHQSAEKQCNCAHFQTQIVNATEGSYTNRFDWHCPVHGSLHKDFETPKGFASAAEKDTYTCEHGVVQPIGTHSHAPVMDITDKPISYHDMPVKEKGLDWNKHIGSKTLGGAGMPMPKEESNYDPNKDMAALHDEIDDTDTSELSRFIREASPEEKKKVWLEIAKQSSADQRAVMGDTSDWERWVRTLANSTNPKDVDLLVAKVSLLIERARQIEHCDEPKCPECNMAAYEAGLKKGREEVHQECDRVQKLGTRKSYEAGRTAATEEFQSKIWKNDEAHKMGRNSAFAEVKEIAEGMKYLEMVGGGYRKYSATGDESQTDEFTAKWHNKILDNLLTKLTDNK